MKNRGLYEKFDRIKILCLCIMASLFCMASPVYAEGGDGVGDDTTGDPPIIARDVDTREIERKVDEVTTETKAQTEELKLQTEAIQALTATLTPEDGISTEAGYTPADNIAMGLNWSKPKYMYKLSYTDAYGEKQEWYICSNSENLYKAKIYKDEEGKGGYAYAIGGLYTEDGKQQYIVGLKSRTDAYEGLWGQPEYTEAGRRIPGSEAYYDAKKPNETWVAGLMNPYNDNQTEQTVQPFEYIAVYNQNGQMIRPWGGKDSYSSLITTSTDFTLERLADEPQAQEWDVEQLYLPVIVIMACSMIMIFRRKY